MRNVFRALTAAAVLGLSACAPDDRDATFDDTPGTAPAPAPAPAAAPGPLPVDTTMMDTVPRTTAPGAPGTTGG